jgi:hypothetical protein
MKLKGKLAGLSTFLVPVVAMAQAAQYIIGITALIIGAVVIWETYDFFQSPTWTGSAGQGATNSVGVSYEADVKVINGTNQLWDGFFDGGIDSPAYETAPTWFSNYLVYNPPVYPIIGPEDIIPTSPGFTFQYGLDAYGNPWIATGNLPSAYQNQQPVAMQQDGTNSVTVTFNDLAGETITTVFSNFLDPAGWTAGYEAGQAGASTTSVGTAVSYITNSPPPQTVVVEHTSDFINWIPLLTNSLSSGQTVTFTDTNVYSPPSPDEAVSSAASGPGLPPGGTIVVEAAQYYRAVLYPCVPEDP